MIDTAVRWLSVGLVKVYLQWVDTIGVTGVVLIGLVAVACLAVGAMWLYRKLKGM